MSFSKARINRFNDVKDCSPSPAKYKASVKSKLALGLLPPSDRCTKKVSPSKSETGSVKSTPCFQTPTVVKKNRVLPLSLKKSKSDDSEELQEKIVECNNKDVYIKELTEQIEELKKHVCSVDSKNKELALERDQFQKDLHNLETNHAQAISLLEENYAKKVDEATAHVEGIYVKFAKICKSKDSLQNEDLTGMQKLLGIVHELAKLYKKSSDEISREAQEKFKDFENKMEIEILEYNEQLENQAAKIQLLEENLREVHILNEIQMKEKIAEIEASWEAKMAKQDKEAEAILKECQEYSEYIIQQGEIEKNEGFALRDEAYEELSQKHAVLSTTHNELQVAIKSAQDLLNKFQKEKRAFELTIKTSHETINVLTKRLFDSDRDVEQLKEELTANELKITEYENKNIGLLNQLQETQAANEELEMQLESSFKISKAEVEKVKKELLDKLSILQRAIKVVSIKSKEKESLFQDVYLFVHQQQEVISEAQVKVDTLKSTVNDYRVVKCELEDRVRELELKNKEYESDIEEAAQIRKKYIDKSGKYDALSQSFQDLLERYNVLNKENAELMERHYLQNETNEKLQDDLDTFKSKVEKLECKKCDLEIKIKDLKRKNAELLQLNIELQSSSPSSFRSTEKVSKELAEVKKIGKKIKAHPGDKENISSPGHTPNRVESPGPLKQKN